MSFINDSTNLSLRAALDVRYRRQELLAQNIANANTPGFKPKDLEFEGVLQAAVQSSSLSSADSVTSSISQASSQDVVERPEVADSLDGNGLDTDREAARIADNSLHFQATSEILRRRYNEMRQVIGELSR